MAEEHHIPTPAGELTIVPAQASDVDTLQGLIYEAAVWLKSRGIQQWPARSPLPRHFLDEIERRLARGESYLACLGDRVVGTISLQREDTEMWGPDDGAALYVHGLVVSRAVSGTQIGLRLLRWAEDMAAAAGRRFLRLDCWAGNPALCAYYERAGFVRRGQVDEGEGWFEALYEKAIASRPSDESVAEGLSPTAMQ
jgi:GNAT superfamily N-acetyltransferase